MSRDPDMITKESLQDMTDEELVHMKDAWKRREKKFNEELLACRSVVMMIHNEMEERNDD